MTHDELLARIKEGQWVDRDEMHLRSNALRAVVELHKPWNFGCSHCINIEGGYMSYPCPTIQVIEKELK
jgi:hypothetical protein